LRLPELRRLVEANHAGAAWRPTLVFGAILAFLFLDKRLAACHMFGAAILDDPATQARHAVYGSRTTGIIGRRHNRLGERITLLAQRQFGWATVVALHLSDDHVTQEKEHEEARSQRE
jgi:hypothetical protein